MSCRENLNVRSGDINQVFGNVSGTNVNIGNQKTGPETTSEAIDELIEAINALRPRLDAEDNRTLDTAVEQLDPSSGEAQLGAPLRKIAGIATYVGKIGTPVIEAIKSLKSLL